MYLFDGTSLCLLSDDVFVPGGVSYHSAEEVDWQALLLTQNVHHCLHHTHTHNSHYYTQHINLVISLLLPTIFVPKKSYTTTCTCTSVDQPTSTCIYVRTCVHVNVPYAQMHVHIRTYMYMYNYVCTHTYNSNSQVKYMYIHAEFPQQMN